MEYLEGGREKQIVRNENTVTRPSGPWTPTIHKLLRSIRSNGFTSAPIPISVDSNGKETISYVHGDVYNYPLPDSVASTEALQSAAALLRKYHDSTIRFCESLNGNEKWWLPPTEPIEVICHGDYAPYNVVFKNMTAVGIIDFDTAHPGSRIWDISYALYRWAPFVNPSNQNGFGKERDCLLRAKQFCLSYGLPDPGWRNLFSNMILRLENLVALMRKEASSGNISFKQNIADGHDQLYIDDIDYLKWQKDELAQKLNDEADNNCFQGTP